MFHAACRIHRVAPVARANHTGNDWPSMNPDPCLEVECCESRSWRTIASISMANWAAWRVLVRYGLRQTTGYHIGVADSLDLLQPVGGNGAIKTSKYLRQNIQNLVRWILCRQGRKPDKIDEKNGRVLMSIRDHRSPLRIRLTMLCGSMLSSKASQRCFSTRISSKWLRSRTCSGPRHPRHRATHRWRIPSSKKSSPGR